MRWIAVLLALLVSSASLAFAQGVDPRRGPVTIGVFMAGSPETYSIFYDAFRRGMVEAGWREGENVRYEVRWGNGKLEGFGALAQELVRIQPALIFAGSSPGAVAVAKATRGTAIPVVTASDDPVRLGLVQSHARPGGNLTGASPRFEELGLKQLEVLMRIRPGAKRFGVLVNGGDAATLSRFTASEGQMRQRAQLVVADVRDAAGLPAAIERMRREKVDGLLVPVTVMFNAQNALIARLALEARIPAIFAITEAADNGALMSYGVDLRLTYMRAARFVDRILRGASPADLPIEFIEEIEVAVNLGTARRLGITIPEDILLRAGKIVE